MGEKLKILMLEDVKFDAELMEYELRHEGMDFLSKRVETEEDFIDSVKNFAPDIILVDHSLPQFDGISALEIAKDYSPYTPFIFVSGKINDEFIVDVLKKGATDYVFKNNLSKLAPAVKRALKERKELIKRENAEIELKMAYNQMELRVEERTAELTSTNEKLRAEIVEREQIEKALRESENKNSILIEAIPDSMFIVNEDGLFLDFQVKKNKLLISPSEFIGKKLRDINLFNDNDIDLFYRTIKLALETDALQEFEHELPLISGNIQLEFRVVKLDDEKILCIVRNITEKKKIEDKINQSLKEKDVLLQEIHHRVKNNLQIISSLLSLQSRYIKESNSTDIFRDSQSRIKSMALIHEKLYQTGDLTRIDMAEYIPELVSDLFRSYCVNCNLINYNVNCENVSLDINTAIPCGLIINELVTNSIKHAFPESTKGRIKIELISEGDYLKIKVQNNGVDFPEELNLDNIKTLGLQLVVSLTKQLDGSIELIKDNGTCFAIIFSK